MSRLSEFAGAFGDVGVFVPLAVGLVAVNGLDATALFGIAGAYYVVTGLVYRVPVSVQPFKAVSAIAIAQGLSAGTVHAGALVIGLVLLVLSFGRLPGLIERVFAIPVVRGIQLGLGLLLLATGLALVEREPRLAAMAPWLAALFLVAGLLTVGVLQRQRWVPALIPVAVAGAIWGLMTLPAELPRVALGPSLAVPSLPSAAELVAAVFLLALPQVPLTIGNSVVAATDVARSYFGTRAQRVRPRWLLRDMGLANLVSGALGGMPMCHGAGGMTAHHRFGARTAVAPIVMGLAYLGVALGLGAAAPALFELFPVAVLGILVGYVGWEHLLLARALETTRDRVVAAAIGVLAVVTGSLALAFGAGLAAYWLLRFLDAARGRRARVLAAT